MLNKTKLTMCPANAFDRIGLLSKFNAIDAQLHILPRIWLFA